MKTYLLAAAVTAALATAPAWAADRQGTGGDDTYASLLAYSQTNPHANRMPPAVEQAADQRAAEKERADVASWSHVMGQGDVPQEYLGNAHK